MTAQYIVLLGCTQGTASFESLRDRTSFVKCTYTLADGSTGTVSPVMNGRRGRVLKTASVTNIDNTDNETICFGLFEDGQVVVLSNAFSDYESCESKFLVNKKPEPFATDLECPESGRIADLQTPGGTESDRCVVIFEDGRREVRAIDAGKSLYRTTAFEIFVDDAWSGHFCIVMDRNGNLRSYEVLASTTTCK